MKIPFFFTLAGDLPHAIAHRLIASVRQVMPGSYIFQQTDEVTPQVKGTDGAIRLPRQDDFAEFFLRHLTDLPNQWPRFIKLDYDCVLMKDLSPLFEGAKWQVGLTKRDDTDPTLSADVARRQPYNNGVMFSNGRHGFFSEVYSAYMGINDRDGWMDAQEAVREAVERSKVAIKAFPCSTYNYTPTLPDEDLNDKWIVHYKGSRKHWGLDTSDMAAAMDEGQRVGQMAQAWVKRKM